MNDEETAAQLSDLARHLLIHGNAADALALLDSAVALAPDDVAIITLQCEAAHRAGRNEQAHERLASLLPTLPVEGRRALSELDARVLLALGRDDEAAAAYARARSGTVRSTSSSSSSSSSSSAAMFAAADTDLPSDSDPHD